ncbi:hypothetical protein ASE63_10870 [Bosea sp. Root381]|uniref:hypothetical protein n=1 Tax=Bosea sp. Root381 TaxID=1736524 RepID=UPI0006F4A5DD|nr:hypothetical protein [Bosea sp. Root381]KRD99990.1 hypothetical protein ASE63_10870 [Bosea sp. Root381]
MLQDAGHDNASKVIIQITSTAQFRQALARLRFLENSATNSTLGRERAALELAVSRYLACREGGAA